MAFSARDLNKLGTSDHGTGLWTYQTNEPLDDLSSDEYWRKALNTLKVGDTVLVASSATRPLQAAQYLVAEVCVGRKTIVMIDCPQSETGKRLVKGA